METAEARIRSSRKRLRWLSAAAGSERRRRPAPLHRDLTAYAEVLARETGQTVADPVKLIVPMLERFIATGRGFAKARRAAS